MGLIINTFKNYQFRHFNVRLIIWVIGLTVLGINVISSATESSVFERKQTLGLIMGICVMIVFCLVSYRFVLKFYWLFYLVNLALLMWVKLGGAYRSGATRWIAIGGFQLQPSEFTKIFLIIFFAMYLNKFKEKLNTIWVLGGAVILFAIPLALVLKQPDLSTSIVIALIFCTLMYMGGLSYKIIGGILAVAIPAVIILIYLIMQPNQKILEEYQYNRIIGFYDENNEIAEQISYQQNNSIMAIGSGGLWGKGLHNNTTTSVKNGNYISEPQTDFIFCIVGEELGFVGCSAVIILLALIIFECIITGIHAADTAGMILCFGFAALVGFQSFINISVVTKIIPNTGLPLPFVSYGLSSLLSLFIGVGLVLNVSLQRKKTL
ncbi:MAG: rod shape-determining protein RodA [Lachnospiraceae bacterium]|nr:rod shape-determining protein RodA [Lachnospiraceae bacterium]